VPGILSRFPRHRGEPAAGPGRPRPTRHQAAAQPDDRGGRPAWMVSPTVRPLSAGRPGVVAPNFADTIATWRNPSFASTLHHLVRHDAPYGMISTASVARAPARGALALPALPLPVVQRADAGQAGAVAWTPTSRVPAGHRAFRRLAPGRFTTASVRQPVQRRLAPVADRGLVPARTNPAGGAPTPGAVGSPTVAAADAAFTQGRMTTPEAGAANGRSGPLAPAAERRPSEQAAPAPAQAGPAHAQAPPRLVQAARVPARSGEVTSPALVTGAVGAGPGTPSAVAPARGTPGGGELVPARGRAAAIRAVPPRSGTGRRPSRHQATTDPVVQRTVMSPVNSHPPRSPGPGPAAETPSGSRVTSAGGSRASTTGAVPGISPTVQRSVVPGKVTEPRDPGLRGEPPAEPGRAMALPAGTSASAERGPISSVPLPDPAAQPGAAVPSRPSASAGRDARVRVPLPDPVALPGAAAVPRRSVEAASLGASAVGARPVRQAGAGSANPGMRTPVQRAVPGTGAARPEPPVPVPSSAGGTTGMSALAPDSASRPEHGMTPVTTAPLLGQRAMGSPLGALRGAGGAVSAPESSGWRQPDRREATEQPRPPAPRLSPRAAVAGRLVDNPRTFRSDSIRNSAGGGVTGGSINGGSIIGGAANGGVVQLRRLSSAGPGLRGGGTLAAPGMAAPGLSSPGLSSPGLSSPGIASPRSPAASVQRLKAPARPVAPPLPVVPMPGSRPAPSTARAAAPAAAGSPDALAGAPGTRRSGPVSVVRVASPKNQRPPQSAAATVQRSAGDAAPTAASDVAQRRVHPPARPGTSRGGSAAPAGVDIEQLVGLVSQRLRAEFRIDRERLGRVRDSTR
jgi:hypothetical protein